jgi:hypothetical protein
LTINRRHTALLALRTSLASVAGAASRGVASQLFRHAAPCLRSLLLHGTTGGHRRSRAVSSALARPGGHATAAAHSWRGAVLCVVGGQSSGPTGYILWLEKSTHVIGPGRNASGPPSKVGWVLLR